MSEKTDLAAVFAPVRIGKVTIKNRLVFPSMCTHYSDDKGSITPRIKEFTRFRAAGGVGMFILPGTPYGTPSRGRPAISEERHIRDWKALKKIASAYGMSLFCQLHPSRIQAGHGKTLHPEDYSIDEIRRVTQAYAEAAQRAKKAGLDGVEIHGAHGHEVAQFLSPLLNRRKDTYGGDVTGRSRFALEIVRSIKKIDGNGFPVIFRFDVEECIPGGRELAESLQVARLLEDAGADALHTTVGGMPGSQQWSSPPMEVPTGFSVHLASEVKRAVSIPVITVGRINDLSLAAQIINEGHADLVAMGRALLADPDLPGKSMEGKNDEIRRCIACNQGCHSNLTPEVFCLQNPRTGREAALIYTTVSSSYRKNVLVAGAGPAGLEAACVLSERGHRVQLYEQSSEAGGTFLLASKPPFKQGILEVIRYRMNRLRDLGVEINVNKKVDLKTIEDATPDVVIVATGSSPAYPSFSINGKEVYSADEVLSGKLPIGKRVLLLGGGMVGCEVADYLANQGYKVDVVEQSTSLASDLNEDRRTFLLERLGKNGVTFILGAKVLEVNLPWAKLAIEKRQEIYGNYDSVVFAIGRRSNNELDNALKNCSFQLKVFTIGDASSPRTALEAIHEAALTAAEI